MKTFQAYLKKEIFEGVRNYKYIVLTVGFIFFAVLDPLILKILPVILKNQIPIDLSQVMKITQKSAMQNYMKDLFQISNIVLALTIMGTLAEEVKGKTLVFPYSKGVSSLGIVLAKTVHYTAVVMFLVFAGFIINHYYSEILFTDEPVTFFQILKVTLMFSIYYMFNISLIIFMSSIFKSGIGAGLSALILIFFMPLLSNITFINEYLPYYLLQKAKEIDFIFNSSIWVNIFCTLMYVIVLNLAASYRMKKVKVI
ncbi:hypothetical protein [Caloranaerobacter ferrireducens]|uniref:hypothetical protein n=1 Tax=Caloranaerobacter ferrireducens TaxID=1323370 RepID=UPI00084DAB04|nr:hypothetical protein [Caloranaerobacter ferrireducens]